MIATLLHSLNNAMQIINEPDKCSEETKWFHNYCNCKNVQLHT